MKISIPRLFAVLVFLSGLSVMSHAQEAGAMQTEGVGTTIPMKKGIIFYEKAYETGADSKQDALYDKALNWLKTSFADPKAVLSVSDKKSGLIRGTVVFKVVTSESGNYYLLKPILTISVKDGSYVFKASNYYEKPVESGISNEYSKIEYRWWDCRQGKPWSSEDQRLFKGLNETTLALMAGLEKAMKQ